MTRAVFAVPGDIEQKTGGYIYDATVLRVLNERGCKISHLELPDSFPDPSSKDMQETFERLSSVPTNCPVIIDGLALGAFEPEGMDRIAAPVVAMLHHPLGLESGLDEGRSATLLQNEARVLQHVKKVIVPSAFIGKAVVKHLSVPEHKIVVAKPGFDRGAETKAPLTQKSDPPLILSVGIVTWRKGHDVLIDALARITDLPWQAKIIGKVHDASEAKALHDRLEKTGLVDRVQICGEVDAQTLKAAYQHASLFALATRYEGYGMVLSEAMMHGLPVISTKVGAVPETVGNAGMLVEPDDPLALSDALRTVLSDQETAKSLSMAAEQNARHLPEWSQTAQVFVDVLEQISP